MNLSEIKTIVNSSGIHDELKCKLIFNAIAKDKNAIPHILDILNIESDAELSRALITLQDLNIGKKKSKPIVELDFVVNEIKKHYLKCKDTIRCNFKIKGLP